MTTPKNLNDPSDYFNLQPVLTYSKSHPTSPQRGPPRLKKDYIWTKGDPIILVGLKLLGLYKVIIPSKPTTVEESIKKDDTETLRLLKGKD